MILEVNYPACYFDTELDKKIREAIQSIGGCSTGGGCERSLPSFHKK